MTEHGLGRRPEWDDRNLRFLVRSHPSFELSPRSRTWVGGLRLDQGSSPACVGFSRSYDLAAQPSPMRGISNQTALELYKLAQKFDEWPGEDYEGSSVLGGCKAALAEGYIGEYRWATSVDDIIASIGSLGPVIMGTDWLEAMFEPYDNGLIDVSGPVAGGHAYMIRGVTLPRNGTATVQYGALKTVRIKTDEPLLRITNSWGREWGVGGEVVVRASDVEGLLSAGGEACVTTRAFRK